MLLVLKNVRKRSATKTTTSPVFFSVVNKIPKKFEDIKLVDNLEK